MFAQINHTAIISHQYPMLGKFYEAVFGLKYSSFRIIDAPIYADGYVGMQIIPRRDGYVGGIDHFGMVVDDVETVLERMQKKHRKANIVKRPSTRPSNPMRICDIATYIVRRHQIRRPSIPTL